MVEIYLVGRFLFKVSVLSIYFNQLYISFRFENEVAYSMAVKSHNKYNWLPEF